MPRLLLSLAASAICILVSNSAIAQPPQCFTNESCSKGEYCACFRNRNQVIGDCDEMGGMCRSVQAEDAALSTRLGKWQARKEAVDGEFRAQKEQTK